MMIFRWIAIIGLLAIMPVVSAHAQIGTGGGAIDVSADALDIDREARIAIYTGADGGVIARQGDATLRCRKLTLYFAPRRGAAPQSGSGIDQSFGDLVRAIAETDVFYITPRERAAGDGAVYEAETDIITLNAAAGKRVQLVQDDNVAEGARLMINLATGQSNLVGSSGAGGRIRTVINPKQGAPAPPAPKPAAPATAPPG